MRVPGNQEQSGFTMVELMVTLSVLVVLMIAAMPSFVDFIDRYRVRGAADGLISVISNARVEAVKSDLDVNVAMTGSGTSWCVGANAATPPSGGQPAGAASACDCTDPASTTECRVGGQRSAIEVGANPGVAISDLSAATAAPFVFSSKLGAISPLGVRSVTLTSPRGKYDLKVEVNALGQARLCVPATKPVISGVPAC